MSETPEEVDEGGEGEGDGVELVRVVLEEGSVYTTLDLVDADPSFWGVVLADLARNVAEALAEQGGGDAGAVLGEVRSAMEEALREGAGEGGE